MVAYHKATQVFLWVGTLLWCGLLQCGGGRPNQEECFQLVRALIVAFYLQLQCVPGQSVQQVIESAEIPNLSHSGYQVYQFPSRALLNPEKDASVLQDQEISIEPMRVSSPGKKEGMLVSLVERLVECWGMEWLVLRSERGLHVCRGGGELDPRRQQLDGGGGGGGGGGGVLPAGGVLASFQTYLITLLLV